MSGLGFKLGLPGHTLPVRSRLLSTDQCSGPVRSGSGFCFSGPGSALWSGSCRTRTDPVRFSFLFRSGFSSPVRVSYFSGPGVSGPGFPTISAYNSFFPSYLRFGSMLERLVLKNGVDCTSQRFKWTSGARVVNLVFNALDLILTNV